MDSGVEPGIVKPDGTTITIGDKIIVKDQARNRFVDNGMRQHRQGRAVTRDEIRTLAESIFQVLRTRPGELVIHPVRDSLVTFRILPSDVVKVPKNVV